MFVPAVGAIEYPQIIASCQTNVSPKDTDTMQRYLWLVGNKILKTGKMSLRGFQVLYSGLRNLRIPQRVPHYTEVALQRDAAGDSLAGTPRARPSCPTTGSSLRRTDTIVVEPGLDYEHPSRTAPPPPKPEDTRPHSI